MGKIMCSQTTAGKERPGGDLHTGTGAHTGRPPANTQEEAHTPGQQAQAQTQRPASACPTLPHVEAPEPEPTPSPAQPRHGTRRIPSPSVSLPTLTPAPILAP